MNSSDSKSSPIKGFFGNYEWLSNFYPAKVIYEGKEFPTVEHGFVYAKMRKGADPKSTLFDQLSGMTPREAKRWGRTVELRGGWNTLKLSVMKELVFDKFSRNTELKFKLLATGDAYIEETNNWNDTFWGVCRGHGRNHLGKIIMLARKRLQTESVFS